MPSLKRVFTVVEVNNGWLISDKTKGSREPSEVWIAADLGDLGKVLTDLCTPIEDGE